MYTAIFDKKTLIHMPVYIDATCSGIQHISAMIADSNLGYNVNLTGLNDKPEDFYSYLVEPINQAINKFGKSDPEFSALQDLYLDRKALKRPIMTQNYNVSIFGMKDQLFELLNVEEYIDLTDEIMGQIERDSRTEPVSFSMVML